MQSFPSSQLVAARVAKTDWQRHFLPGTSGFSSQASSSSWRLSQDLASKRPSQTGRLGGRCAFTAAVLVLLQTRTSRRTGASCSSTRRSASGPEVQDSGVESDGKCNRPRVAMVQLGCSKNTVDAEVMLGDLVSNGHVVVKDPDDAEVIIVNTCGFIDDAREDSVEALEEMSALKEKEHKSAKHIIVTGCMAQRYGSELIELLPGIDAVVGFEHYPRLSDTIEGLAGTSDAKGTRGAVQVGTTAVPFRDEAKRHRLTAPHTAYLRVAEGCDHSCTFCAIPNWRGRFRSKPYEQLLAEAKRLVSQGVRELCLIAEDTNQYGQDLGKDAPRLHDLLYALEELEGLHWVRLLYCFPSYFSDELIDAIAACRKVCRCIDVPLQHTSEQVLRRMKRPARDHTLRLLHKLQDKVPDLYFRTTMISGFPGETEAEHGQLLEDISGATGLRILRGGGFRYSEEEGTSAADMDDAIDPELREVRQADVQDEFLVLQEEWANTMVGCELEVMVDRMDGDVAVCRTEFDAPEVDNEVLIPEVSLPFEAGTLLHCRILEREECNLIAEVVG